MMSTPTEVDSATHDLKQLMHQRDNLLREKKQVEAYVQEVEGHVEDKDKIIAQLTANLQAARRATEDAEKALRTERALAVAASAAAPSSNRRTTRQLPSLPGSATLRRGMRNSDVVGDAPDEGPTIIDSSGQPTIETLQSQIRDLESALQDCRKMIQESAEFTAEMGPSDESESPDVMNLRDELHVACRTLDNDAMLQIARKFHTTNAELDAALESEVELQWKVAQLEEENGILRVGYEQAETGRLDLELSAQQLRDELDESYGKLEKMRAEHDGSPVSFASAPSVGETLADERRDEELKECKLRLAKYQLERKEIEANLDSTNKQLMELNQQTQDLLRQNEEYQRERTETIDAHESALKVAAQETAAIEERELKLRKALEETKKELGQLMQEHSDLNAQLKSEREMAKNARSDIKKEYEEQIQRIEKSAVDAAHEEAARYEEEINQRQMQVQSLQQSHQRTTDELKKRLQQTISEKSTIATALAEAKDSVATKSTEVMAEHNRAHKAELEQARLETELAQICVARKQDMEAAEALKDQLKTAKMKAKLAEDRCALFNLKLDSLNQELDFRSQELDANEKLVQTLEDSDVIMKAQIEEEKRLAAEAVRHERAASEKALAKHAEAYEALQNTLRSANDRYSELSCDFESVNAALKVPRDDCAVEKEAKEAAEKTQKKLVQQLSQADDEHKKELSACARDLSCARDRIQALESEASSTKLRIQQLSEAVAAARQQRELALGEVGNTNAKGSDALLALVKTIRTHVSESQEGLNRLQISFVGESDGEQKESLQCCTAGMQEASLSVCKLDAQIIQLIDAHAASVATLEHSVEQGGLDIARLTQQLGDQNDRVKLLTADLQGRDEELRTLKGELDRERNALSSVTQTRQELEEKISVLLDKLANSSDLSAKEVEQLKGDIARQEADAARQKSSVERLEKELIDAKSSIMAADKRRAEVEATLADHSSVVAELETLKISKSDAERLGAQAALQVGKQKEQISALKKKIQIQVEQIEQLTINGQESQTQVDALQAKYDALIDTEKTAQNNLAQALAAASAAREVNENAMKVARKQMEAVQEQVMAVSSERDDLREKLTLSAEEVLNLQAELEAATMEKTTAESEVVRHRELINMAGINVKKHIEAVRLSHAETAGLRRDKDEALQKVQQLKQYVENREEYHKKTRAKIIERADTEIKRLNSEVEKANLKLQNMEKAAQNLVHAPDLKPTFDCTNAVAAALESALKMKPSNFIEVQSEASSSRNLADVCTRIRYATKLVGLLASLPRGGQPSSSRVERTRPQLKGVARTVPLPELKSAPGTSPNGSALESPVDRLLSAVKKFYQAKNSASEKSAVAADSATSSEESSETTASRPGDTPADDNSEAPVSDATCIATKANGDNTVEFSPESYPDDSTDDPAIVQPKRALTLSEQENLFQDWRRVKIKLREVVKQLVGAKAAVAYLRFQEEQTKVYAGNRDRLVARMIEKLQVKKKREKTELLRMLSETGM